MSAQSRPGSALVYELTIAGGIGPIVRNALRPQVAEPPRLFTILRTGALSDRDVVDLVLLLHSRGLDIECIFETTATGPPEFRLTEATAETVT